MRHPGREVQQLDDLTQKLQSLLSDPESMRDLKELAAMLHDPPPDEQQTQPESAAENPLPDLSKLLAVGQALSQVQQDETAALLLALKPHLSAERARRTDKAVRMLRLWAAADVLRENGMLQELFGDQQ